MEAHLAEATSAPSTKTPPTHPPERPNSAFPTAMPKVDIETPSKNSCDVHEIARLFLAGMRMHEGATSTLVGWWTQPRLSTTLLPKLE